MDRQQAIKTILAQGDLPTLDNISKLISTPVVSGDDSTSVKVINFDYSPRKLTSADFIALTRAKYSALKNLLLKRSETQDATSISKGRTLFGEKTTIITAVSDIHAFHTGTIALQLEDFSGQTKAIISGKNPELVEKAKFIALDEVIAFKGTFTKSFFMVKDIIWPDVPIKKPVKYPEDVYVAFSGDIHAGSDMFLPDELNKFIKWLRGEEGTAEQKAMAKKTKYVFLVGDIVDGIGIYPGQEKELEILELGAQFQEVAKYLKQIPQDKQIIICPGNHDGTRIAEPQPPLDKKFAAPLYELPNVTMVTNPAIVNIHAVNGYAGVNVLMYHGYSFDGLVNQVEGLREVGGYDKPDEIMKFVLKRRHLAPIYGSTLQLPLKQDPLVINSLPDVLVTGHLHKVGIGNYKGILTIGASCWQAMTSFMEKVGHHPEPGKVPVLNLRTWKVKLLEFD